MAETEETVEGMRTPKCASTPNFSSLFEWFSHHVFLNSFAKLWHERETTIPHRIHATGIYLPNFTLGHQANAGNKNRPFPMDPMGS